MNNIDMRVLKKAFRTGSSSSISEAISGDIIPTMVMWEASIGLIAKRKAKLAHMETAITSLVETIRNTRAVLERFVAVNSALEKDDHEIFEDDMSILSIEDPFLLPDQVAYIVRDINPITGDLCKELVSMFQGTAMNAEREQDFARASIRLYELSQRPYIAGSKQQPGGQRHL